MQGLETTAVYDHEKGMFVMNSPTVTSAKFWPGLLGIFATHTVLQAQTIVEGKTIGVQTFVVEIRNQYLNNNLETLNAFLEL